MELELVSPLDLPLGQLWSPALPPLEGQCLDMLFVSPLPGREDSAWRPFQQWCCCRAPIITALSKELSAAVIMFDLPHVGTEHLKGANEELNL